MTIYLCGAIEYSPDHGKAWRSEVARLLTGLGHKVYDPAQDEKKDLTEEEQLNFRSWKQSNLPRFQQTLRKIIQYDLDWIEQHTDALVVYWDEYALQGAGTQGELTMAYRHGLPIYMVTHMPVEQISGWVLGCASHIFGGFAELHQFLADKKARASEA